MEGLSTSFEESDMYGDSPEVTFEFSSSTDSIHPLLQIGWTKKIKTIVSRLSDLMREPNSFPTERKIAPLMHRIKRTFKTLQQRLLKCLNIITVVAPNNKTLITRMQAHSKLTKSFTGVIKFLMHQQKLFLAAEIARLKQEFASLNLQTRKTAQEAFCHASSKAQADKIWRNIENIQMESSKVLQEYQDLLRNKRRLTDSRSPNPAAGDGLMKVVNFPQLLQEEALRNPRGDLLEAKNIFLSKTYDAIMKIHHSRLLENHRKVLLRCKNLMGTFILHLNNCGHILDTNSTHLETIRGETKDQVEEAVDLTGANIPYVPKDELSSPQKKIKLD